MIPPPRPSHNNGVNPRRPLPFLLLAALCAPVTAKIPVSVLGAYVENEDSAYCENLARDIGQSLAEDTAFLVYDLRKKHGPALDSLHAVGPLRGHAFLSSIHGGSVKWGLIVECRRIRREEEKEDFACRAEALGLIDGKARVLDTLRFLPQAAEKEKRFAQSLARPIMARMHPVREAGLALGALKVKPPANPALLIRDLQIIQRGPIKEIPLGTTLVIGDAPQLIVLSIENVHYILYPNSSYTYLLPKVVQLNEGTLGILQGEDSASLGGRLKQATALDGSNLVWRSLAKLAALDSSNLIWKGLGKVTSLDSSNVLVHNSITRTLGKTVALDSSNLLFRTLAQVTALDTSNLVLRTLGQVAAMDSNNLIWKGLGKVGSLDSNNIVWKKLSLIATLDSNSVWKKLGLLAFQDSTVVLTPSFIARGMPEAAVVRSDGGSASLEVIKGSMIAQALLGSQEEVLLGALRSAKSRGFAFKVDRVSPARGDRVLREFESVNPARSGLNLANLLPGKLFAVGSSLRTADRPVQAFLAGELRELDIEADILSSEKEGWQEFGTFRPGAQEQGCYLCSPDRLGP